MRLQLALVCDHAEETADGKLDLRGVFSDLAAPGFPAKHDMVLVLAVEWSRDDLGKYDFEVDLTGPSGKSSMTIQGHSDVDRRDPTHPPARTRIVMPLQEVIFPEPGAYQFRIRIKGREYDGPSLFLMELEPSGTSAG
jgi:hypothetical protein